MKKLKFETILIIAAIASVIYYFYNKNKNATAKTSINNSDTNSSSDSGTDSSSDSGTDSSSDSSTDSYINAVELGLGDNIAVANLGSNRVRPQVHRQNLSFAQAASSNSFFGKR